MVHEISREIKEIDGKEGKLTEILRAFLDAKKVRYKIAEPEPGTKPGTVVNIKGVSPFIESGSVIIEKNGARVIIEELSKVCGISSRFHDRNGVNIDSILDRARRIVLRTHKGSKDLYIHTNLEAKEPMYGLYIGGGEISTTIKDALEEPSDIPESDETYEINCECKSFGELRCKGRAWGV